MLGCGKFLSVGGVRCRCPCSGVWLLRGQQEVANNQKCVYKPEQEAQLPLRNMASSMHFFVARLLSIAVTIETYVRLTGWFVTNTHTVNKLQLCRCARNSSAVLTHDLTCRLTPPFRRTPANPHKPCCQKLESLKYVFAVDSVSLSVCVFARLF